MKLYSNLSEKRRLRKDHKARTRAEYLASLPKHPVKRTLYRLHPKRVVGYWFSKRGALTALKLTGIAILLGTLLVGGVFVYYRKDVDQIRPEKISERVQTTVTTYLDRDGNVLWEDKGGGNYRLAVKSSEISDYMKEATIAIEDRNFYDHSGVSFSGIVRSAVNNARGGEVQGGSTLTQQLVKQVFLADEAHKRGLDGVPRKIKEIILAIEVERMYNKEQILNLYLNESSYGGPRNGVESAAQTYFGKHAKDLSLAESALLAAIPNQPGLYDPYNTAGNEYLVARQQKVLRSMVESGAITQAEADKAKKVAIIDTIKPVSDQYKNIKAPHFVLWVRSQLEKELGETLVGRGGLTVKTTLDSKIQEKVEASMNDMFNSYYPGYAGFTNGAAMVQDVDSGQVLAMLGSRDFRYTGFGQSNAATAFIQPGSTIKPFVYAELFQDQGSGKQNFGAGSIIPDVKTTFDGNYTPQNADRSFDGPTVTALRALGRSRNIPAITAMSIVGKDRSWDTIRALGDKSYCTQGSDVQAGLSSAIGGCTTKMYEHVNATASLARGGAYMNQSAILEVKNISGTVLKKFNKPKTKQVVDPQAAYIVNHILGDAPTRASLFGNSITPTLDAKGIRVALKTGTSDIDGQPKDLWNIVYTPKLAMSVWLGNPDPRALSNGNSSIPSRIADPVMAFAVERYAAQGKATLGDWFTAPSGIQMINGQPFPSYYNKSKVQSTDKMTFDKVSKKKATNCTPSGARIEMDVVAQKDPLRDRKIYLVTNGYDPTKEDDVHKCGDAKPNLNVSPSANGKQIFVNYASGKFDLKTISVKVNGQEIANFSVSGSGTRTIQNSAGTSKSYSISAQGVDDGYYTANASGSWKKPSDSGASD